MFVLRTIVRLPHERADRGRTPVAFLDESTWRGRVYSGGWKQAAGGDAAVVEPATGAELGRTGIAGPADVAAATAAAAAAQPAWAAVPYTERAAILRRAGDTEYSLSLGILTRDVMAGLDLARRIPTGIVHINDQTVDDAPN